MQADELKELFQFDGEKPELISFNKVIQALNELLQANKELLDDNIRLSEENADLRARLERLA